MERAGAFKPKTRALEIVSQEGEKVEGPLQSLEKDQSEVTGFNFALERVLNGEFTNEDQLQALVEPSFVRAGGVRILTYRNSLTPLQTTSGLRIEIPSLGGAVLAAEQIPVLVNILKEKAGARQEKESVEARVTGFNFALERVLNGEFTNEDQLQALVEPSFVRAGGVRILTYRNSLTPLQTTSGLRIEIPSLGGAVLAAEDFELSKRILSVLNNQALPEEIRANIRRYLQTNGAGELDRLKTLLNEPANDESSSEIIELIDDVNNSKRISALKRDVYTGIAEDKPVDELLKTISAFEGREVSDIKLSAELKTAVAAKRKREIISASNLPLQAAGRDIGKVLAEVTPLLGSSRLDEIEAGQQLVKASYRVELANFNDEIQKMITAEVDPEMVRIYIDGFTIRPSLGDIDYVQAVSEARDKAFQSINAILVQRRIALATSIRNSFATQNVQLVLSAIDDFPSETEEDQVIKTQLLGFYRSFVATNKPEIFDATFAEEIKKRQETVRQAKFVNPEKGSNKKAFNFVRSRFVETIYPLVESLRADAATAGEVKSFLEIDEKDQDKNNPRSQFEQRMRSLEAQRPLTDTERNYLQSVELLSLFNPYLVACVYADPGVTSEFLRHHFERVSKNTTAQLKDGDYVPLLHIGLGPNGLAAIGEIVRNNPDLASAMLAVDAGNQPGGPFAIPEGPAWELNSANKRGSGGRTLPKNPGSEELESVRSYGSPLRWYPGERGEDISVRQGSINTTVDYLITPDDISTARYTTNEELQLVLSLQSALLTNKVALKTRVVRLEKNTNPHTRGDKLVTLETTDETGVRQVTIGVDALSGATGLGEAGYGFKLEGSRAEQVINETEGKGFPKISRTLEAFNALAGRSNEQVSPGETLVVWGKGNSADVLIEYIGNIFQGGNQRVRDITKVYVICEGDLSARPRYALISDLKPRNGRGNLIELVNARVADVDFASEETDPTKRKLLFYGNDGQTIKDAAGIPLLADSAIAATGFRSQLGELVDNYALEVLDDKAKAPRKPLALPTNEKVAVAETLTGDPTVIILGTASESGFDSVDKLAQLPVEAREALLRNGAENAVAIGFRSPDTQAALNIWLNSQDISVEKKPSITSRKQLFLNGTQNVQPGEVFNIDSMVDANDRRIPNNIKDEIRLLSPLLSYNVGNSIELLRSDETKFTGEFNFTITYDDKNQMLGLTFNEDNKVPVTKEFIESIEEACSDMDFQKYAFIALRKKRRNPKLDLVLSFKNGFIDPKSTFVQD